MNERESRDLKQNRLMYFLCMLVHTALCIIFCLLGVKVLFYFNIGSVMLYLSGVIWMRSLRHTGVWMGLAYLEVEVHALLCNLFLGYGFGFSLYGVLAIPVSYYVGYTIGDTKNGTRRYSIMATTAALLLAVSCICCGGNNLLGRMPDFMVKDIFALNLLICIGILITYSILFVRRIRETETYLYEKNEELKFLAGYDALTKLRNRRSMGVVMQQYEKEKDAYCMLLGDIDDFKHVNDTYSHNCGDMVLVEVAETLSSIVGENGVVCRWGGEEILILLDCGKEKGLAVAEQIRSSVEEKHMQYNEEEIKVSMTFGFAFHNEAKDVEKLVALADARLYVGKGNGKNQVVSIS